MALRSGLAGQIGLAPETTYGTYVPPTKFVEGTTNLKDTSTWATGGGVAAGRMQKLASRRVRTGYGAAGSLSDVEVVNKGMGALLAALMGSTAGPTVEGAGPGYKQTHTLGDTFGKSLTIQAGIPDLQGTVRPHTYLGSKVLGATFSCAVGGFLTSTWDLDARELVENQTLATASYPVASPFSWVQSTLKIGATAAAAAAVDGVRGVSVNITRPQRTDRIYAGTQGKKKEPVLNDWQAITGSFDVDYMDKTVFADRFHAGTAFGLVWEFVGGALGSSAEMFRITLDGCNLTGETPGLAGPDIVTGAQPFEWLYDGTNLPKIEYISTDTTL